MDAKDLLVERIRAGLSTIVIGEMPPMPRGITVVRVVCDEAGTQGPLSLARETIERMLDGGASWADRPRAPTARRMLGSKPWKPAGVAFVDACNRLYARARGRVVVVMEGIDAADEETHRILAEILRERGRLDMPLVLVADEEPRGAFAEVARALQDGAKTVARPPAVQPPAPPRPHGSPETALPPNVLRALRGAAMVGPFFDATIVASLLDVPLEELLEDLQHARDIGVPIDDRGDGRFVLPEDLATALAESVMPSLRKRWHERLGALFSGVPETPVNAPHHPSAPPPPVMPRVAPTSVATIRRDPLRAAAQLAAAGRPSAAFEQHLDAVSAMIDAGEIQRATAAFDRLSTSIDELPFTTARNHLETRVRIERARLRWLGSGDATTFSLSNAFDDVMGARAMLAKDAPAVLRTHLAATLAGIAYDLGEPAALERADAVLVESIARLLQDGHAIDAASLLNEQAALKLRRDDVRAAGALLDRSRALFESQARATPPDAAARAELADTDHLLARLPLHWVENTRAGESAAPSAAACEVALDRARSAEKSYQLLGMRRELARVWDTMARLESRLGRIDLAHAHFETALATAAALGDQNGLARANAGLAELLATAGQPEQAVGLLRSSLEANREKGSTIGLSFDARALSTIERAVQNGGGPVDGVVREELAKLRAELAQARAQTRD
jgi:tetratricopeptide (TPR) repeat protein